jgi:hypothetical protein
LPFILGVQSKVTEFGLGYVAHGPKLFGLQPFGGAGVAALQYKPTAGGGEHLPEQVRAGFYYAIGLEESVFSEHFGLRVQFRQLFFGAPDFNQNYFATGARSMTTEPVAGFFVRF